MSGDVLTQEGCVRYQCIRNLSQVLWWLKDYHCPKLAVIINIIFWNFYHWHIEYFISNCFCITGMGSLWWWVSIGSGNDLLPSGNKPLPTPMLTLFFRSMRYHEPTWMFQMPWHQKLTTVFPALQTLATMLQIPSIINGPLTRAPLWYVTSVPPHPLTPHTPMT